MVPVKAAIQRLLDTHDPYPGEALDKQWNVVLHNRAAGRLLGLLPAFLQTPSVNVFRARSCCSAWYWHHAEHLWQPAQHHAARAVH